MKAAKMSHLNPPYVRAPGIVHQTPGSIWVLPRRIENKIEELHAEGRRELVKSEQTHYAFGLLSVTHDLERVVLKDSM
jgi:hypothetical protein